jgi:hypothetical protein
VFVCESRGESLAGVERCPDDLRAMQRLKVNAKYVSYRALSIVRALLAAEPTLPAGCEAEDHFKEGFSRVSCGKTFLLAIPRQPYPPEALVQEATALEGRLQRTGATKVQRVAQKCLPPGGEVDCYRWWVTLPDDSHLEVVLARSVVDGQAYMMTYYWNDPSPAVQTFFTQVLGMSSAS